MKHVVITGASTGIGKATADVLAAAGYHIFGSVRTRAQAERLKDSLGPGCTPLMLDVTDQPSVADAADHVAAALDGRRLAGLVNNAGIALGGPLMHQPLDALRRQFEVNVFGLIAVTQAFLPLLGAQVPQRHPPGRVINMSSVGGKITFPFLGAYAASKHAVEALSDALRRELALYGIDVIVIEPGTIRTPIWDKAEEADTAAAYAHTDYGNSLTNFQRAFIQMGRQGLPPEVVGRTILTALERRRPRARYPIPDRPLRGWLLPRLLPDRWLDRLITSQIGLGRGVQPPRS